MKLNKKTFLTAAFSATFAIPLAFGLAASLVEIKPGESVLVDSNEPVKVTCSKEQEIKPITYCNCQEWGDNDVDLKLYIHYPNKPRNWYSLRTFDKSKNLEENFKQCEAQYEKHPACKLK